MEKKTVILSLIYKFSERFLVKGLGLFVSIVLARLLLPEEFGQIAIILVFANISQTLVQGGFNTALVQNQDTSESDYSTVFYISFGMSIVLVCILWVIAPLVDSFYGSIGITIPMRVYSFTLLFAAFNSIQVAKMQRELEFKKMMISTVIATIISGSIAIYLAYNNFGIWALVVYYFSNSVATCIAMMFVLKWRPMLAFSKERAGVLFSYGWKMMVSAILCSVYNDVRSLIIGKVFSQKDLGFYNRGQQFPDIIGNTLDNAIQSVMFPVFSRLQSNKDELRKALKKTLTLGSFIIMPAMIGLAAISEPLICILLTEKWLPCVIYMQIICIGNMTIPLTSSNLVAIKALGRSDIYMKLEFIRRAAMLLVLMVSVIGLHTVKAIAWGYAVSAWIDYIITSVPLGYLLQYGLYQQIQDIWKYLITSIAMAGIVFLVGRISDQYLVVLPIQIFIGCSVYFLLSLLLKCDEINYIKKIKALL